MRLAESKGENRETNIASRGGSEDLTNENIVIMFNL